MRIDTLPVGLLMTNCYIVSGDDGVCALIDPGDEPEKLLEFLREKKLRCEAVLITHGHFDHVGGVDMIIGQTGARLVMSPFDEAGVGREIDQKLEDGSAVVVGSLFFLAISTPGHSPDGFCYLIGETLFSGDTLFFESVGRTDLPGGDYDTLMTSINKLKALGHADLRILPGHMRETTLSHELKYNPFLK